MDNSLRIKQLETELATLKKEEDKFNSLQDDHKLAEILHKHLCKTTNHTDGCGFYYEKWDNPGYSKKEWLNKSQAVLKIVDIDTALKVANCLI